MCYKTVILLFPSDSPPSRYKFTFCYDRMYLIVPNRFGFCHCFDFFKSLVYNHLRTSIKFLHSDFSVIHSLLQACQHHLFTFDVLLYAHTTYTRSSNFIRSYFLTVSAFFISPFYRRLPISFALPLICDCWILHLALWMY